jgi:hypothetical protein
MLYPTTSGEVLATHERLTVCTGAARPVPVTVPEDGVFEALLVNETLAEAAPLFCGVKVTVKSTLWPLAMVTGKVRPLMANAEFPTLSEETVTLAPVAFSVPV